MLILILSDVQYSQKAALALKKVRIVKITSPQVSRNSYRCLENPDI